MIFFVKKYGFHNWLRRAACILLALNAALASAGCGLSKTSSEMVEKLDYTVVEDEDVPKELLEMIDAKKANVLRLTYATNEYLYMVAGYGEQETSGYSIRLDDLYLGENAIYIKTSLIGPRKKESVSKINTYPYIVIKIEKRDEPVIFE